MDAHGAVTGPAIVIRAPRVASRTRRAEISVASPPSGATTWSPTGRLSGVSPHGIEAAGRPVRFEGLAEITNIGRLVDIPRNARESPCKAGCEIGILAMHQLAVCAATPTFATGIADAGGHGARFAAETPGHARSTQKAAATAGGRGGADVSWCALLANDWRPRDCNWRRLWRRWEPQS